MATCKQQETLFKSPEFLKCTKHVRSFQRQVFFPQVSMTYINSNINDESFKLVELVWPVPMSLENIVIEEAVQVHGWSL